MSEVSLRAKMESEGLSEAFIVSFLHNYADLVNGETGMIPESSIAPVDSIPSIDDLPDEVDTSLLDATVVLKLNGGLGTSMGLEKAKSLLKVFVFRSLCPSQKQRNCTIDAA